MLKMYAYVYEWACIGKLRYNEYTLASGMPCAAAAVVDAVAVSMCWESVIEKRPWIAQISSTKSHNWTYERKQMKHIKLIEANGRAQVANSAHTRAHHVNFIAYIRPTKKRSNSIQYNILVFQCIVCVC